MIAGLCDTGERIPARVYDAVRRALDPAARLPDPPYDCPCCAFWRGFALAAFLFSFVAGLILYFR